MVCILTRFPEMKEILNYNEAPQKTTLFTLQTCPLCHF